MFVDEQYLELPEYLRRSMAWFIRLVVDGDRLRADDTLPLGLRLEMFDSIERWLLKGNMGLLPELRFLIEDEMGPFMN